LWTSPARRAHAADIGNGGSASGGFLWRRRGPISHAPRIAGLILTEVLVAGLVLVCLMDGPVCAVAGLLVLGPIAGMALWDHLDTERRIRRERRAQHGGFEVAPPDPYRDGSRGR
jgi:hypothetical protein